MICTVSAVCLKLRNEIQIAAAFMCVLHFTAVDV